MHISPVYTSQSYRPAQAQKWFPRRWICPSNRARLQKLEVRNFGGIISEWPQFWDSFESAIHKNEVLADVDKFSCLRGLLVGPARSAIAGFAITSANYKAATDLLKRWYGKKNAIQRAHINALLNFEPIYSVWRGAGHIRCHCGTIATRKTARTAPVNNQKRRRSWDRGIWSSCQTLGHKVDLREEYNKNTWLTRSPQDDKRTTMYAGNCAFCLGGDKHEDCKKVTQVSERKRILLKYGRCFNCIKKGHVSIDYKTVVNCNFCKGKQHSCLCCPDSPGEGR